VIDPAGWNRASWGVVAVGDGWRCCLCKGSWWSPSAGCWRGCSRFLGSGRHVSAVVRVRVRAVRMTSAIWRRVQWLHTLPSARCRNIRHVPGIVHVLKVIFFQRKTIEVTDNEFFLYYLLKKFVAMVSGLRGT